MITLNQYRQSIHLDEEFKIPYQDDIESEFIVLLLLEELNISKPEIPVLYSEKRKLLQSLITTWNPMSNKLSDFFYNNLNQLLQIELADKVITTISSLPTIEKTIPETRYPSAAKSILWRGDITTLKTDAIVNAANSQMLGCFQPFHKCIDNAIHCAAGIQLRNDCYAIMQIQGKQEETGTAKITRAYNLPSKYVLHTVGPIVSNHKPTELQKEQLSNCYYSCLEVAREVKIRSIAFCAISTGVFGYPSEDAAFVALKTVNDWIQKYPSEIDSVVFNVFSEKDEEIYINAIKNWI